MSLLFEKLQKLRGTHPYVFIGYLFTVFLVYGFTLLSPFRWDDIDQIVKPWIIHSITNIPSIFLTSIRLEGSANIVIDIVYRPVSFSVYAILYSVGGGKPLYFHLFQTVLFGANAFLVYFLFSKFFLRRIAVALGFVFLLHPLNQEIVTYIANMQEALFFFFGFLAISLKTSTLFSRSRTISYVLPILFLSLAILSKESGALFLATYFLYGVLFDTKSLRKYTKIVFAALSLAFILRVAGSFYWFLEMKRIPLELYDRIIYPPILITFYIREFFLPSDSISYTHQIPPKISLEEYLLSLIFVLAAIIILSLVIRQLLKRSGMRKATIFFTSWLVLGILLHVQLFPLDQFVAKRWMYFPLVGLLGIMGLYYQRYVASSKYRSLFHLLVVLFIIFCIVRTTQMNTYWMDEKLLLEHVSKR